MSKAPGLRAGTSPASSSSSPEGAAEGLRGDPETQGPGEGPRATRGGRGPGARPPPQGRGGAGPAAGTAPRRLAHTWGPPGWGQVDRVPFAGPGFVFLKIAEPQLCWGKGTKKAAERRKDDIPACCLQVSVARPWTEHRGLPGAGRTGQARPAGSTPTVCRNPSRQVRRGARLPTKPAITSKDTCSSLNTRATVQWTPSAGGVGAHLCCSQRLAGPCAGGRSQRTRRPPCQIPQPLCGGQDGTQLP